MAETKYTDYADNMDNIDPRGQFSYGELKDFADMYWLKSVNRCSRKKDFSGMERFLTDDCEIIYSPIDIEPPFFKIPAHRKGKEAVMAAINEGHLAFPGWTYAYANFGYMNDFGNGLIIDPRKSVIIMKLLELSPYMKNDGTPFRNSGYITVRLYYAGAFQVKKIVLVYEPMLRLRAKQEIIAAGLAPQEMIDEVNARYALFREQAKAWGDYLKKLYDSCEHPDRDESDRQKFFNYLDKDAVWQSYEP